MSRHRNVRSMNYEDEYDGYDDVYGHSVEDDYCVSPATASQFLYDRGSHKLSSFFNENPEIPEEEHESEESDAVQDSTGSYSRPRLSSADEAKLNSCLEVMRDIVGDTTPEHVLAAAVIESGFDQEKALNKVFQQQEVPKPQREPKPKRQNRDYDENLSPNLPSSPASLTPGESNTSSSIKQIDQSSNQSHLLSKGSNVDAKLKSLNQGLSSLLPKEKVRSPNLTATSSGKPDVSKFTFGIPHKTVSMQQKNIPANIPKQPPGGFSLAALAQEHKSQSPKGGSPLAAGLRADKSGSSGSPRFGNPAAGGLSLAAMAKQYQTSKSPTHDSKPAQVVSSGSSPYPSLSALAQQHQSGKSLPGPGLKGMEPGPPKVTRVVAQDSAGFSLSDLAKKHSEKSDAHKLGDGPRNVVVPKAALPSRPLLSKTDGKENKKPAVKPAGISTITGPVNLAQLAAQHSPASILSPGHQTKDSKFDLDPIPVAKAAKPSNFGRILCKDNSANKNIAQTTAKRQSKFSYHRQKSKASDTKSAQQHVCVPFKFDTPSPDDIIKEKQKGAFTRGNERKLPRVSTEPQFTIVPDDPPAPVEVQAARQPSDLSNNVARMTFTTNTPVSSGFTPEKNQEGATADLAQVQGVRRNLGANLGAGLRPVASAPCLENMATPKKESTPSKSKHEKIDTKKEFEKRKADGKDYVNLVVIGHVDAGKSTLMGHVLYQLGFVNKKTMHKYEQESKKMGKASFQYAWVLDETEEERSRGVTMDVAQTRFETKTKIVTLLDAPGHKDFIPNMITGAAQADVAVLVVNATRGEFETGFEAGGQTREHAMLIRSLGVSQLCVAVNKMDTVGWEQDRYKEITKKLGQFLKQAGFREDVPFIPCSGLNGENLCKPITDPALKSWYIGPTLVDQIDKFKAPERAIDKPFRMCAGDIFKGMGSGFSVSGTIQAGSVQPGDKVLIMPQGEMANVKSITIDEFPSTCAFAGDNIVLTITGIDMTNIGIGSILCNPSDPIKTGSRITARVVIFNIELPITKGFNVVFHYQSMSEPAHVRKLISLLHKSTGEVIKKKPRCLTKNNNAMIEIELDRPICIELYKDFRELGRFMLRYAGSTVAAGLVTEINEKHSTKVE